MTDDELQIRRYLLGQLGEQEEQFVEQRIMTDAEFYRRVSLVEDDLTDQYAAGLLSQAESRSFEDRFLPVPGRQRTLRAARLLADYTSASHPWKRESSKPLLFRPKATPSVRPERRRWATVALVVLLVGLAGATAWTYREITRLRDQIGSTRSSQPDSHDQLRQQVGELQGKVEHLTRELETERASRVELEKELASARGAGPRRTGTIAFLLTPGMLRNGGEVTVIKISRQMSRRVNQVRLNLKIDGEPLQVYRATVRSPEGEPVWRQTCTAQPGDNLISAPVTMRAASLKSGDYIVVLEGGAGDSLFNRIGTYYFRVVKD
jgi:hypothetical protein